MAGRQTTINFTGALLFILLAVSIVRGQTSTRRPKIPGVSHVGFYVSNLPKTVAFWDDFLGYAEPYVLKRKDGSTRMAFIKINDRQHIELFAEEPPAGHSRLSHIAFLTDNAEQMRAYLQSRGIAVKPSVGAGRTGDLNFEVKDPDGHLVEFVQSQPAG